jgi:invasion protein IalB
MMLRYFAIIFFACLVVTSATADETNFSALTYSHWAKFCLKETCFTSTDGRANPGCVAIVSAALIERDGGARKTLRVTVPIRVSSERGVNIIIGQDLPIERTYTGCSRDACMVDYDAGPELVDQLKRARTLVIEPRDKASSLISFSVPLANFTEAYDGPAREPKAFELTQKEIQAELESRRRDEADRKTRCQ